MSRAVLVTLALLFIPVLAGCKGQCRQLSEKLCECSRNTLEKDACIRRASAAETSNPPNASEEELCRGLLESCDCNLIDTPEGKRACGLAR